MSWHEEGEQEDAYEEGIAEIVMSEESFSDTSVYAQTLSNSIRALTLMDTPGVDVWHREQITKLIDAQIELKRWYLEGVTNDGTKAEA
jgi:hypothetical protein|tara:strand:- start:109 stop:372 length:264 start_codon:yes stop_codon:yes gene_type:complete